MKESITDYEKLIKEVRTLEGMYFKGEKIIQTTLSTEGKDSYCFLLCNIKDCNFYYSDVYSYNTMLKELDRFKSLCYKPLEIVHTINILTNKSDDYLHHHNASHYLKNLSSDLTVKYVDNSDDLTDINLINKEIKHILDEKYN